MGEERKPDGLWVLSAEEQARLDREVDRRLKGEPLDPVEAAIACERMDQMREEIFQRVGLLDIAVPYIRALRDGDDEFADEPDTGPVEPTPAQLWHFTRLRKDVLEARRAAEARAAGDTTGNGDTPMNTDPEPTATADPPTMDERLARTFRRLAAGESPLPEDMRAGREELDRLREAIFRRQGLVDIAVPFIRAARDGGDELEGVARPHDPERSASTGRSEP